MPGPDEEFGVLPLFESDHSGSGQLLDPRELPHRLNYLEVLPGPLCRCPVVLLAVLESHQRAHYQRAIQPLPRTAFADFSY